MMVGHNRSMTPIKNTRKQPDTVSCQTENAFLTIPETIPLRNRRNTTLSAPSSNSNSSSCLPLINTPTRSFSLETSDLQSSTFEGLTTPQSQLMKVLYLSEKHSRKCHEEEESLHSPQQKYKKSTHLTVDTFIGNSSSASSSCDSFLSLTISSNSQTPTNSITYENPPEIESISFKEQASDSVISEGQIMSSILVEIVRYLVIPLLDFVILVFGCFLLESPVVSNNGSSSSDGNLSITKIVSNHVGDLLHNNNRIFQQQQQEVPNSSAKAASEDDEKFTEISLEIPSLEINGVGFSEEEKSKSCLNNNSNTCFVEKLMNSKKQLEKWLSLHQKTVFSRNGKSCRALVRNEVKHLSELTGSEFSRATSLTDLIEYWRKSV